MNRELENILTVILLNVPQLIVNPLLLYIIMQTSINHLNWGTVSQEMAVACLPQI